MTAFAADGRPPVENLYAAYDALEKDGWIKETVIVSIRGDGAETLSLPIVAYRTPQKGQAVWILSGIHGEEPAGPAALAESADALIRLGQKTPVVVLPLCNPCGYARNWRYLNRATWDGEAEVHSVGDSEHVLPDDDGATARKAKALSPESAALASYILKTAETYPPRVAVDLHEDDHIDKGYVYALGDGDAAAGRLIAILSKNGVAIATHGWTRFDEEIENGRVIHFGPDGSVDELLSSETVVMNGKTIHGPAAPMVLVAETPAKALPLETRKNAMKKIVSEIENLFLVNDVGYFCTRLRAAFARAAKNRAYAIAALGTTAGGYALHFCAPKVIDPAKKNVLICGGFHGDEPAGPWGIVRFLETATAAELNAANIFFLPLVNPSGLARGTRENADGADPNQGLYGDAGPAASQEGRVLRQHLQTLLAAGRDGMISLHEDYEFDKTYIWSHENAETPGAFSREILAALTQHFPVYSGSFQHRDVVIRIDDGIGFKVVDNSFESLMIGGGVPFSATTETPFGGEIPLERRVVAQADAVRAFLKITAGP